MQTLIKVRLIADKNQLLLSQRSPIAPQTQRHREVDAHVRGAGADKLPRFEDITEKAGLVPLMMKGPHVELRAGVDVELPNARCYVEPLAHLVRSGEVDEALVDRALTRVLDQKVALGLLDPDWSPEVAQPRDFDSARNRDLARRLAEESVVLVANDGTLPVREPGRVALVGPLGDDPFALLGCYSFPAHIGVSYPDWPHGIDLPTFRDEIARIATHVDHVKGCDLPEGGADFDAARAAAADADLCVAVVGDRAGLFGRGTSGEGCDAADLRLPGDQEALVEQLLETGTPVVLVVSSGRPYALGRFADRVAAEDPNVPGVEAEGSRHRAHRRRRRRQVRVPYTQIDDVGDFTLDDFRKQFEQMNEMMKLLNKTPRR